MLEINKCCNFYCFCFVLLYLSVLFFVLCIRKLTMILLSVGKDIGLLICDNVFVIHWGKCFIID